MLKFDLIAEYLKAKTENKFEHFHFRKNEKNQKILKPIT